MDDNELLDFAMLEPVLVPADDAPDPVSVQPTAAQPSRAFGLVAARPSTVTIRDAKVAVVAFSLGALFGSVLSWFAAPGRAS
jgi:hypothetical protein